MLLNHFRLKYKPILFWFSLATKYERKVEFWLISSNEVIKLRLLKIKYHKCYKYYKANYKCYNDIYYVITVWQIKLRHKCSIFIDKFTFTEIRFFLTNSNSLGYYWIICRYKKWFETNSMTFVTSSSLLVNTDKQFCTCESFFDRNASEKKTWAETFSCEFCEVP